MSCIDKPSVGSADQLHCCWVCGSPEVGCVRASTLPSVVTSETFRITNSDYGRVAAIYRCRACGFHQCSEMKDVLHYYQDMEDDEYEATRSQRALQERALLARLSLYPSCAGRRLLDVGAGSGILVEEALKLGFDAVGVEPSASLQSKALQLNLPVYRGVLPHPSVEGTFDVITLVDVIEHVPDPVGLLTAVAALLDTDGIIVVVTPDRRSLAARIMRHRWWHYRVGHIGYFDQSTIALALNKAGLAQRKLRRPGWYFPADYLFRRVISYLPASFQFAPPLLLQRITLPLNLYDSIEVEARLKTS